MKLLFIGDIVGRPGRQAVKEILPDIAAAEKIDFVVANAENAAGGSGITSVIYKELIAAGLDGMTMGDHVFRRGTGYQQDLAIFNERVHLLLDHRGDATRLEMIMDKDNFHH